MACYSVKLRIYEVYILSVSMLGEGGRTKRTSEATSLVGSIVHHAECLQRGAADKFNLGRRERCGRLYNSQSLPGMTVSQQVGRILLQERKKSRLTADV